ncbi:MAG TPA: hypothetical protein VFP25_04495 [Nitrososphaeraceae archaeon]|jgi:hypothetical protein|nr:hypothetical protein [Nitrososphaeraceae archaeon]
MVEKMTALWLIILTIITCASVPVFMVILTSPHPAKFILGTDELGIKLETMNYLILNISLFK